MYVLKIFLKKENKMKEVKRKIITFLVKNLPLTFRRKRKEEKRK